MNRFKRWKLKRRLSHINFEAIDTDPDWKDYRENSGEYHALKWLKSYTKGLTAEPEQLFESMLDTRYHDLKKANSDLLFMYTLYRYIK
jgi:hypothetical protein